MVHLGTFKSQLVATIVLYIYIYRYLYLLVMLYTFLFLILLHVLGISFPLDHISDPFPTYRAMTILLVPEAMYRGHIQVLPGALARKKSRP